MPDQKQLPEQPVHGSRRWILQPLKDESEAIYRLSDSGAGGLRAKYPENGLADRQKIANDLRLG